MDFRIRCIVLLLALAGACASAQALSPAEVFRRVAPSVWVVRPLDVSDKPFGSGSGVVIAPGRMVTNCHVLARARGIQVRRGNVSYGAKLEHADVERDLCTLTIEEFNAPAVEIRPLADVIVGERVYTVGNPAGLSQTLAEGLISGLRPEDAKLPPIQTSAPISPGSSGGGLFDEQGRLIGITTLIVNNRERLAQNLNFAMPAEWIAEVPARAAAVLTARKTAAPAAAGALNNPASGALPGAGATYRYQWTERQFGRRQEFSVQVTAVDGWNVSESFSAAGVPPVASIVDARIVSFSGRRLGEGQSLLEFAPYLEAKGPGQALVLESAGNYPTAGFENWTVTTAIPDWDTVTLPAGSFRALRVEIRGSRQTGATQYIRNTLAERFEFTAWYAPEVRRYVRLQHRSWGGFNGQLADELVELVEYRRN
jgi:S1-C subfamily serine protease